MVLAIIGANPAFRKDSIGPSLRIAECFCDTIQGENFCGVPSVFLRLQGCTLDCAWCDSGSIWRFGNPYSIDELLSLWEEKDVILRLRSGHHLVLTGGSPLLQQESLAMLIRTFIRKYGFKPFIEIENECTLKPRIARYVDLWNNSPKLSNSGMKRERRYHPDILKTLSRLSGSYFKFVIRSEDDWQEIMDDFLSPRIIKRDQVVIMPEGQSREEMRKRYQFIVDLSCRENIRMTDRLHITIWNKKKGV